MKPEILATFSAVGGIVLLLAKCPPGLGLRKYEVLRKVGQVEIQPICGTDDIAAAREAFIAEAEHLIGLLS